MRSSVTKIYLVAAQDGPAFAEAMLGQSLPADQWHDERPEYVCRCAMVDRASPDQGQAKVSLRFDKEDE